MTDDRHLIDIMQLSSDQLRVIRVLLRQVEMTFRDLLGIFQAYPIDQRMESSQLHALLDGLNRASWIHISHEQGQEDRYRINLGHAAARIQDASILDQLNDQTNFQYQPPLKTLTSEIPRSSAAEASTRTRTDALNDLIGRRGGKRTVPQSIWDKLEGDGGDSASQPDRKPGDDDSTNDGDSKRKTGKDLLSLF